jgi:hypothetical protein
MYTLEMTVDGKTQQTQLETMPASIVLSLYRTDPPVKTLVATKVVL